jgi:hypothetical protein
VKKRYAKGYTSAYADYEMEVYTIASMYEVHTVSDMMWDAREVDVEGAL